MMWHHLLSKDPNKPAAKARLLDIAGVERGRVTSMQYRADRNDIVRGRVLVKVPGNTFWTNKGVYTGTIKSVVTADGGGEWTCSCGNTSSCGEGFQPCTFDGKTCEPSDDGAYHYRCDRCLAVHLEPEGVKS